MEIKASIKVEARAQVLSDMLEKAEFSVDYHQNTYDQLFSESAESSEPVDRYKIARMQIEKQKVEYYKEMIEYLMKF